jgi:methylated-DNA-[protein]-cysteine S-methyltransferase
MHHYSLEIFNTDLRWICLLWKNTTLARLSFYHDTATGARAMVETEIGQSVSLQTDTTVLSRSLTEYAKGEQISFSDIPTCASRTSFQQKVLSCCQQIPYGCTMTYGEIAKKVGHLGAARAVGGVMRTNNCPLVVPCHRVLGSNGKLTGFSAGTGLDLKHRLLQMEGINREFVF